MRTSMKMFIFILALAACAAALPSGGQMKGPLPFFLLLWGLLTLSNSSLLAREDVIAVANPTKYNDR
jgi:hypothetical protein